MNAKEILDSLLLDKIIVVEVNNTRELDSLRNAVHSARRTLQAQIESDPTATENTIHDDITGGAKLLFDYVEGYNKHSSPLRVRISLGNREQKKSFKVVDLYDMGDLDSDCDDSLGGYDKT
jgi:hypothetical protein